MVIKLRQKLICIRKNQYWTESIILVCGVKRSATSTHYYLNWPRSIFVCLQQVLSRREFSAHLAYFLPKEDRP